MFPFVKNSIEVLFRRLREMCSSRAHADSALRGVSEKCLSSSPCIMRIYQPEPRSQYAKAVLFSACEGQERGEVAEHLAKSWHYVVHEMVKRFHLDQHHWD